MATIKCGDFIKYNKETVGNLTVWLSGYYTGEDDESVIDFDKMVPTGRSSAPIARRTPA